MENVFKTDLNLFVSSPIKWSIFKVNGTKLLLSNIKLPWISAYTFKAN